MKAVRTSIDSKPLPIFASHTVKARSLQTICAKACSASKESRSQRFRSTWVAHLQQAGSPSSSEGRSSTGSKPIPAINIDMVIIGVIMLLIPGVAMTNATRDMLSGATISGVMRFIESLFLATSLVLGFMGALWLASLCGVI